MAPPHFAPLTVASSLPLRAARTVYLADNDFFGERSLLTGDPVSATVTALTYCDLLMLSAAHFASLLADDTKAHERFVILS